MSTFTTSRSDMTTRASATGGSVLMRVVSMIEMATERRRSRLARMELSDAPLKDIGVSRSEAFRAANGPLWI